MPLHTVSSTIKHEHHHHVTAEVKGDPWIRKLLGLIAFLLLLLFLHGHGWAQTTSEPGANTYDRTNKAVRVNVVAGGAGGGLAQLQVGRASDGNFVNVGYFTGQQNVPVNCVVGCSASGSSFSDNGAFTAGTTSIGITGGWFSNTPTNCTSGSACAPQLTVDRKLFVNAFQGTSPWVVSNGGTFATQAAQSGTWTVTANAGTGTFAISAASLPLPTGAATSAKQPALGTAGTPSADVLSVQGITSMTPLKVDGSAVTQPVSGTVTANAGTGTFNVQANASVNVNQVAGAATAATNPLYIREADGTNAVTLDPCRISSNSFARIGQTASAQVIAGTAAKKTYICSINLVTAGANNVAIVEGTGTTCATGIAGVSTNGTTAATGWNFAANGGLTQGNGMGSIMAALNANADNVCVLQSAAVQLSGVIGYVQQ